MTEEEIKNELGKDYPDFDKIEEIAEKLGQTKYKEYKIFTRITITHRTYY